MSTSEELSELARLREENAVLKSQVENADINLEQVRMNARSQWQRKVESAEARIAELVASWNEEHQEAVNARKQLIAYATVIERFGNWLNHWSLKSHREPSQVYAAWDEARTTTTA